MGSLDDKLKDLPVKIRAAYLRDMKEIRAFQRMGYELREKLKLNPLVEHNALTREMHPTELRVVNWLCRDTKAKDAQTQLRGWKWVLRQEWGKDLRASPYEQRYYDVKRPEE